MTTPQKPYTAVMLAAWHAINTAWGLLSFVESVPSWEQGLLIRNETSAQIAKRREMFRLVQGELPGMLERRYAEMIAIHAESLTDTTKERAYEVAFAKWQDALTYCAPTILALHGQECGCDWAPDHANIFTLRRGHHALTAC